MIGDATGPPLVLAGTAGAALAAVRDAGGDPAEGLLTAVERERAERFRKPADTTDFVAAHTLVRLAVARLHGRPLTGLSLTQTCATCGGPHGQPVVPEAAATGVSLSHSGGFVAAAAAAGAVGVDIERVSRASADPRIWRTALSPREITVAERAANPPAVFLRQWVRKEAMIKIGVVTIGTMHDLDLADLPTDEAGDWTGARTTRWQGRHLLDWSDPATGTVGAAVANAPPTVTLLR